MTRHYGLLLGLTMLVGCSSDADGPTTPPTTMTPTTMTPPVSCTVPDSPYGMAVNATFPRMTLTDCDSEEPYAIYDEAEFCGPQVTVMLLVAGWCGTCQSHSAALESSVNARYRDRGVRVIEVMLDNPDRTRGTAEFCRTWKSRYHLTNRMLLDSAGNAARRFAGGTLPGVVVFDNVGRIRYVGHGSSLNVVRYQVDAILDGVAEN